jgi:DnaJ-class molecular chaperone
VAPTASREEIDAAFRARALQCHPDKVAHLDPDFRELAERKFRELIAAYEALAGEAPVSTKRPASD